MGHDTGMEYHGTSAFFMNLQRRHPSVVGQVGTMFVEAVNLGQRLVSFRDMSERGHVLGRLPALASWRKISPPRGWRLQA